MANVMIQQLDAHLTAAPKLEFVQVNDERKAKVTFVAISNSVWTSNDTRNEKSTAVRWTAWGKAAEAHAKYLSKGSHVNVTGRIDNNNYEKDGEEIFGFNFTADDVHYLDSKEVADLRKAKQAAQ